MQVAPAEPGAPPATRSLALPEISSPDRWAPRPTWPASLPSPSPPAPLPKICRLRIFFISPSPPLPLRRFLLLPPRPSRTCGPAGSLTARHLPGRSLPPRAARRIFPAISLFFFPFEFVPGFSGPVLAGIGGSVAEERFLVPPGRSRRERRELSSSWSRCFCCRRWLLLGACERCSREAEIRTLGAAHG